MIGLVMIMTREVNYFQRILKHQYPTLYDKVSISVSISSDYQQSLAMNGIMRTELNYHHHSSKQDVVITFPNIGGLYYDISFYINFVWGTNDVHGTFDYSGTNHFKFTV